MHSTLATLKWKNKVKPSLNLEISIVDNDINKGKLQKEGIAEKGFIPFFPQKKKKWGGTYVIGL